MQKIICSILVGFVLLNKADRNATCEIKNQNMLQISKSDVIRA